MKKVGELFSMAPDGFGYVVEPDGRSYVFAPELLGHRPPAGWMALEGQRVRFAVTGEQVSRLELTV